MEVATPPVDGGMECCKDATNRQVIESTMTKTVEQCKVCGCKHYEFTVDPIKLGVKVA